MLYPEPTEPVFHPNGVKIPFYENGKPAIDEGIIAITEKYARICKIRCPNHKKQGDYTFKSIETSSTQIHWSEINPYSKVMAMAVFRGLDE